MSNPQTPDDAHAGQAGNAVFDRRDWLQITLSCIGDGVITADAGRRVNYLNPVAEKLTGWTLADAVGKEVEQVFQIVNETTRTGGRATGPDRHRARADRRAREPYPPYREGRQRATHRRQRRGHQG